MKEDETISKAIETLRAVLTDIGWDARKDDETEGFIVDFDPPYIPLAFAYAAISADPEVFVFYLNLGVSAAADRRDETARFLTLANSNLMVGNFEIGFEDGLVRFRSSVPFQGTELSEVLIRNTILSAMDAVERYAEGVIDVMARGKSAEQVFHQIESAEVLADDLSNETTEEESE